VPLELGGRPLWTNRVVLCETCYLEVKARENRSHHMKDAKEVA